jgi:hypothetical protein
MWPPRSLQTGVDFITSSEFRQPYRRRPLRIRHNHYSMCDKNQSPRTRPTFINSVTLTSPASCDHNRSLGHSRTFPRNDSPGDSLSPGFSAAVCRVRPGFAFCASLIGGCRLICSAAHKLIWEGIMVRIFILAFGITVLCGLGSVFAQGGVDCAGWCRQNRCSGGMMTNAAPICMNNCIAACQKKHPKSK